MTHLLFHELLFVVELRKEVTGVKMVERRGGLEMVSITGILLTCSRSGAWL